MEVGKQKAEIRGEHPGPGMFFQRRGDARLGLIRTAPLKG
jgi:hypothetical protein